MFERLTKWNGKKYVLPQGHGMWRLIAETLAAYENLGSAEEIKAKLERKPTAEDLSESELEKAFRIQEHNYLRMDASYHVEGYIDNGRVREEDITDDVLEEIVTRFEHDQSCECSENAVWENVIEDYIKEHLTPSPEDVYLMQSAYHILVEDGEVDLDKYFKPVLAKNKNLWFYQQAKKAYDGLQAHDIDEATGFLGEIFSD